MSVEKPKYEDQVSDIYKKTLRYVEVFLEEEKKSSETSETKDHEYLTNNDTLIKSLNEWWEAVHIAECESLIKVISLIDTRDKEDGKSRLMKGKREAILAEITSKNAKTVRDAVNNFKTATEKSSQKSLRISWMNLVISSLWFIFTIVVAFVELPKRELMKTILNQQNIIEKLRQDIKQK